MFDTVSRLYDSSLHRNAGYMILRSAVVAMLGFVFWNLAARLYDPAAVGATSALVSGMNLLGTLSLLGVTVVLVRYLAQTPGKEALVSASYTLALMIGGVVSLIFVMGVDFFSPALSEILRGPLALVFLVGVLGSTLRFVLNSCYTAARKTEYTVLGTLGFTVSKLLFLPLLTSLSVSWIFGSWVIGIIIGVLVLVAFFRRGVGVGFPLPSLDLGPLRGRLRYALVNHAGSVVLLAGNHLLPILVANLEGVEATAYFYIPWMIGNMLHQIPLMVSQSFFAEASAHHSKMSGVWRRSLKLCYALAIPASSVLMLGSGFVLRLFGPRYAENSTLLLILICLSTPMYCFNRIYLTRKRVENKLGWVLGGHTLVTAVLLGAGIILLGAVSVTSFGYGLLLGHGSLALLGLMETFRSRSKTAA